MSFVNNFTSVKIAFFSKQSNQKNERVTVPVSKHASEGRGSALSCKLQKPFLHQPNREFVGNYTTEEWQFLHPFFPCCKAKFGCLDKLEAHTKKLNKPFQKSKELMWKKKTGIASQTLLSQSNTVVSKLVAFDEKKKKYIN